MDRLRLRGLSLHGGRDPGLDASGERQERPERSAALTDTAVAAAGLDQIAGALRR